MSRCSWVIVYYKLRIHARLRMRALTAVQRNFHLQFAFVAYPRDDRLWKKYIREF